MPKKILVAYGTRYDSTEKVAMKLAERIIGHGHHAELKNLQISPTDYIASYDGIIVGTGMKKAGWTIEIDNFLKQNKTILQEKKFGFFICSGHSAKEKSYAKNDFCLTRLNALGISPHVCNAVAAIANEQLARKLVLLENFSNEEVIALLLTKKLFARLMISTTLSIGEMWKNLQLALLKF